VRRRGRPPNNKAADFYGDLDDSSEDDYEDDEYDYEHRGGLRQGGGRGARVIFTAT